MDTAVDNVKAETFKNEGNDYFKKSDYSKAVELYTKAVEWSDGSKSMNTIFRKSQPHLPL